MYDPPNPIDKAYYPCVMYDADQFSGHGVGTPPVGVYTNDYGPPATFPAPASIRTRVYRVRQVAP